MPTVETPAQLIEYYGKLLIMEYYGLPKAVGTIAALARQAVASMIVLQVRAGYSLGTATGKQLDCLGELIGVSRSVPNYIPGTPEFALPRYADPGAGSYIGFARYAGAAPDGHWKRYTDSDTSYIMSDGVFAQFIEFLVAVRASNYSIAALSAIFFRFFGTNVTITDNFDMTMTYTHQSSDPGVLFGILDYLELLPHPAGVSYSVVNV
jgi:hypothetical protein